MLDLEEADWRRDDITRRYMEGHGAELASPWSMQAAAQRGDSFASPAARGLDVEKQGKKELGFRNCHGFAPVGRPAAALKSSLPLRPYPVWTPENLNY